MAAEGNFLTNAFSSVMGMIKPVTDVASHAVGAVGGVAQGALTWGKAHPAMAIGAVALAAVGTAIVANNINKDKEENTNVRGGWADREMQRREVGGQNIGR